jgi:hypothetical protein
MTARLVRLLLVFNWIRKMFCKESTVLTLDDREFGRLTYDEGDWKRNISTSCGDCILWITAPPSGPSDLQRDFLRRLLVEIPRIEIQARLFIEKNKRDQKPISLYSLSIGEDEEVRRGDFVVEFLDANADVVYVVDFREGVPKYYGEDD